ncbi:LPD7 domain-containing protein [Vibrio chemaguriensis]
METEQLAEKQTYLVVPYEERNHAVKAAGKLPDGQNALKFDDENKLWYAKPGTDLNKVNKWIPDPNRARSTTSESDPVVEFSETLKEAGLVLKGLPEMDGKRHRVSTLEDKKGQQTGVYVGYLDGVPAGWYQDHRKHDDPVKWKATGQKLDKTAQDHLKAIAVQNSIEREANQNRKYEHNAHRAEQAYNLMPDATPEQGYLAAKGVKPFPGAKMDKQGRLVLPLRNENGDVRTLQRINESGFKSLKKNGQKTGNYHVVGEQELKNGEPILYAEGYSTSASISEATNRPVVMTVDAGNLPTVAAKLKEKYPDSPHIMLGDDDRTREVNKGQKKAQQAAELTGGLYRVPAFNYQEQKEGLTDFNDLHQSRGLEAVREQVEEIISQATRSETRSKTNMSAEPTDKQEAEPVVTKNFEQYVSSGLGSQSQSDLPVAEQENKPEPKPEISKAELEPGNKEPSSKLDSDVVEHGEDNSVEPYIEQKKESEADLNAQRWLKSRESLEDIMSQDDVRDEKRQQQLNQTANLEPNPRPTQNREPDPFSDLDSGFKPVVPEKISKSYVEVDGKYYFAGRPDSLAFVDKGAKLQTKLSSSNVASSMVDIAEARGWTELQVKGTEDFRREAWLEASSRGLGVRGYKPKEEDLARLKKLASERQPNEIEAREQADQPRVSPGEKEGVKSAVNTPDSAVPKQTESLNESDNNAQDKEDINRLAGKLVEHGKAPYEHNPDNRQSYYVTLENTDGQKTTTWGIDLERAVKESESQPGDQVELENKGRKPVTVSKEIKDDKGNVVDTQEINTHRNTWEVKAQAIRDKTRDARDVVKEHPDLVNEVAAVKVAEKFSQKFDNEEDRNRFMEKVRSQVADNVSTGQKQPEIKLREQRQLERSNQDEER